MCVDGIMLSRIKALTDEHPWMDHTMAETVLKLHDRGVLRKTIEEAEAESKPVPAVQIAITVEQPAELTTDTQ